MVDPNQAVSRPQPRELLIRIDRGSSEGSKKDIWERLQAIAAVLTPLVVAYFTYQASGQLDTYIKQRQLEVTSASAMSSALQKLMQAQTNGEADQSAVELANFGSQALLPLLYVLQDTNDARAEGARKGIELLASTSHADVCKRLVILLGNKTGLYRFNTHSKAVSILGRSGCANGSTALVEYRTSIDAAVGTLKAGKAKVAMFEDSVGMDKLRELRDEVDRTLTTLSVISAYR